MSVESLLDKIQSAEEGSDELDLDIAEWIAEMESAAVAIQPWTTSLDAKLPWENIVSVQYNRHIKIWGAWHRDQQGNQHLGEAKTEALARRAAALKGRPG